MNPGLVVAILQDVVIKFSHSVHNIYWWMMLKANNHNKRPQNDKGLTLFIRCTSYMVWGTDCCMCTPTHTHTHTGKLHVGKMKEEDTTFIWSQSRLCKTIDKKNHCHQLHSFKMLVAPTSRKWRKNCVLLGISEVSNPKVSQKQWKRVSAEWRNVSGTQMNIYHRSDGVEVSGSPCTWRLLSRFFYILVDE